jgi:hypothetical protein
MNLAHDSIKTWNFSFNHDCIKNRTRKRDHMMKKYISVPHALLKRHLVKIGLVTLTYVGTGNFVAQAQVKDTLPLTEAQCFETASQAAAYTGGDLGTHLGSDGCNQKSAGGWVKMARVVAGRCEFKLHFTEGGTQMQCNGKNIPSPGYLFRKAWVLKKFRGACQKVGFTESLYQKTPYQNRYERTITCRE